MGSGLTRDEILPLWPDSDPSTQGDEDAMPHPDGRAWRKACEECAFRTSDPQMLGYAYQRELAEGTPGTHFYCLHRRDGEHHRVCACYAAIQAGRAALEAEKQG